MDAYRAVVDKRDQRIFLDRPIPEATLRRILQAGRMTGSSKNREPNRFVVVRARPQVAAIAALGPQARWVAAAAAVVVIVQTERHEYDAGRCAQNMMVVAWGDGVGSCPAHVDEGKLGALLGVPPGLHVNRLIAFGYVDPARPGVPKSVARRRRPLDELTHLEHWRES
jgi:nitroreductase